MSIVDYYYENNKGEEDMKNQRSRHMIHRRLSASLVCTIICSEAITGLAYGAPNYEMINRASEIFEERYMPEINADGEIPGYAEYLKGSLTYSDSSGSDYSDYGRDFQTGDIYSDYIEAAINDEGRFTIGNRIGRDDTTNDDNQKLLFGHPDPRTSYTTIFIDGEPHIFTANSGISFPDTKTAIAKQMISGVEITQTLHIVSNEENGNEDTVNISYTAKNIDNVQHTVGFRIMLDTMLGDNDGAPFKVPGVGNVTTELELKGNDIPKYWQAYDHLENANVFAVGTLYQNVSERPDKLQFASWNDITDVPGHYNVVEGRSVTNDSAVAVYWDEISLKENGIRSVSTSYGVGYSKMDSGMTQNVVVPNDYFGILVLDENAKGISGAAVILSDDQVTTDDQGLAIFKVTSEPGTCQIDVKKDGYSRKSTTVNVVGGLTRTVTLTTDTTNPIIGVSASYNGNTVDLLSEYISFNEYKENSNRDTEGDTKSEIIFNIQTHTELPDASYQIWSGNSKVTESDDPSLRLDVYESIMDSTSNYHYPILKDCKAGENVELRIYQNGNRIARKALGIRVYSPESYAVGTSKVEVDMKKGLGFSVKVPDNVPIIGNSTINIGENHYKIPLIVHLEKNKIKIGLNLKQWSKGNDSEYSDFDTAYFYRALEKAKGKSKEDREKGWKQLQEVLDAGDFNYGDGFVKGKAIICGYGEAEYKGEGLHNFSIQVHVLLNIKGEMTYHTMLIVVPAYVKLEGSAELGAEGTGEANVVLTPEFKLDDFTWDLDIKPSIQVKPGFGIGINSFASVGLGGSLKLSALYKVRTSYAKADLNGSIFMEVYFTPWFHQEKKFANKTWNLCDGYVGARSFDQSINTQEMYEDYLNLDQYELVSLSNINPYSSGSDFDDIIINSKIPRGNTIHLIRNSQGDTFAFYFGNEDDTLDNTGVMLTKIMTDANGNEVLSDPVRITEMSGYEAEIDSYNIKNVFYDTNATPSNAVATASNAAKVFSYDGNNDITSTSDMYYNIYQEGDIVYIAVSKAQDSLSDISDISEVLKTTDIYITAVDLKKNEISKMTRISNNNTIDINPQIYHDSNGIHIAWISVESEDGDLFSETAEFTINFYDEKTHEVRSINIGNRRVSELVIGKLNNKVVAVYSANVDVDRTTLDDLELFAYDGITETQITHNDTPDRALRFYDNNTKLMWYQGGAIYETSGINEGRQIISTSAAVTPNFQIIEGDNKLFLAWEDIDPEDDSVDIYMLQKKNENWGNPFIIYKGVDYITSPVVGFIDEDGPTLLHISTDNIFEDDFAGSALILSKNIVSTNLSIGSVSHEAVRIGDKLPLMVSVKNNGSSIIKEIKVSVDDGEEETVSVYLEPGEEKKIKITEFTVPEIQEVTSFTVCAEASKIISSGGESEESKIWELDETDNTYTFELGYTDLMVDTGVEIINEEDYVVINIKNISDMPSDTNLKLLADSDEGAVLVDTITGEIPAEATRTIKYRLRDISADSNLTQIVALITPMREENVTENNRSFVYVGSSIVRYHLNLSAGSGGSIEQVSGTYEEGSIIELKAFPFEGYRFVKWNSSDTEIIENQYSAVTTLQMPAKNINITAVFEKDNVVSTWDLMIQPGEGGSINGNSNGAYAEGTEIRLMAVADEGYQFVKWNCNIDSLIQQNTAPEVIFKMPPSNVIIEAEFEKRMPPKAVQSITISPTALTMKKGETTSLSQNIYPEDADNKAVTWHSTDPSVASIDEVGTVKAVKQGTAEIYCVSQDGGNIQSNHCAVKVISGSGSGGGGSSNEGSKDVGRKSNTSGSGTLPSYVVKGSWIQGKDGTWSFTDSQGTRYVNAWAAVENPYANPAAGQQAFDWFRFDENGKMVTGWYYDELDGYWYYLNPVSDGTLGRMITGWYLIDDFYYYFNPNSDGHKGRMYANETTPDSYYVDSSGRWVR